jgi:hypothetical protein
MDRRISAPRCSLSKCIGYPRQDRTRHHAAAGFPVNSLLAMTPHVNTRRNTWLPVLFESNRDARSLLFSLLAGNRCVRPRKLRGKQQRDRERLRHNVLVRGASSAEPNRTMPSRAVRGFNRPLCGRADVHHAISAITRTGDPQRFEQHNKTPRILWPSAMLPPPYLRSVG